MISIDYLVIHLLNHLKNGAISSQIIARNNPIDRKTYASNTGVKAAPTAETKKF